MQIIKKFWSNFKTFDWGMYFALCFLALVPAIYQTVVTKVISVNTSQEVFDIIGQMEWFDLIDETIRAFLIIPLYSILSKAKQSYDFSKIVFKLGIAVFGLYFLFSIGVFFDGTSLIQYMNPNSIDIESTYHYLILETIAFIIGIISSYTNVVLIVIDKPKHMYALLTSRILLNILIDFILIPNFSIYGVAIGNIISNSVIVVISIIILIYAKQIHFSKFSKNDKCYLKDLVRVGLFAGGQQFLDNIIYSLMIVRMVNAVSESGNYWISNNFIWGWLLIPISCLSEIIRKDAGENKYDLKQINYYSITMISIVLWFVLIPTYKWFFVSAEGLTNANEILEIVIKNLAFYIAYAFSQIPDAIFVGMGKTKYNTINSLICNIGYYGIWFVMYQTKTVMMDMNAIIIMFGCGNVVHWIVSLIEEKIFLKRELANL